MNKSQIYYQKNKNKFRLARIKKTKGRILKNEKLREFRKNNMLKDFISGMSFEDASKKYKIALGYCRSILRNISPILYKKRVEKIKDEKRNKRRDEIEKRKKKRYSKYGYKYGHVPSTGDKFHKWTVIDNTVIMIGKEPRRYRAVTCQCECGSISLVGLTKLFSGKSKGCKHLSGEATRKRSINEAIGTLGRTQFAYFKNCATRRGFTWELSMRFLWNLYVKQKGKCALSGIPITLNIKVPRKNNTNTASLDRINSTKGYVKKNMQWVHKDINRMKSNFSDEHFIKMCGFVNRFNRKKNN